MKPLYILLLSAAMTLIAASHASAQQSIRFDSTEHDFGTIAEEGGKVSCDFRFTNISSEPIVIMKVVSSCGCTASEFSRQPVMPDGEGRIRVTFDPADYSPWAFSRSVSVFPSAGDAIRLTICGRIIPRKRPVEETHPILLSDNVRIDANSHSFGYAEHGKSACGSFEAVNTSDRPVHLRVVRKGNGSGPLRLDFPDVLQPGQKAQLNFCYVLPEDCGIYGTLDDILDVYVDGKMSEYRLHINATAIDNRDFFADTEEPRIELSENFIKFGSVKHGKQLLTATIAIRNTGVSPLAVRKIESERGRASFELDGPAEIRPGKEGLLKVTLRTKPSDAGAVMDRLRIITNDPRSPMRMVRVSAIVIE